MFRIADPTSIVVDPTGNFVYIPNTSTNSISVYTINSNTGALAAIADSPFTTGSTPHRVAVDFTGNFLYVVNADSDNVSAYSINSSTGVLTEITGSPFSTGNNPWCIAIARIEQ